MSGPKRIQRKRSKGWRMPEGAVYVGRPTQWGNPFTVERAELELSGAGLPGDLADLLVVTVYRTWVKREVDEFLTIDLEPLRGRDLACWCPLDRPCHADVLLELANA